MWCNNCDRETFDEVCMVCGLPTQKDIPTEMFWCGTCNAPIILLANSLSKEHCLDCGSEISYLASDLRKEIFEECILNFLWFDKCLLTCYLRLFY